MADGLCWAWKSQSEWPFEKQFTTYSVSLFFLIKIGCSGKILVSVFSLSRSRKKVLGKGGGKTISSK